MIYRSDSDIDRKPTTPAGPWMKPISLLFGFLAVTGAYAQTARSCFTGTYEHMVVRLDVLNSRNGIGHVLQVGEYRSSGDCTNAGGGMAMYCKSDPHTMAFELDFAAQAVVLRALGEMMLSHPVRLQDHLIIRQGSPQDSIDLSEVNCWSNH